MKKLLTTALVCGMTAAAATGAGPGPSKVVGAVFAATNDTTHNEVVMYSRTEAGALKYIGNFSTGGRGEGGINDPLQAEGSVTLTADHQFLLVVNAGSSTLSLFRVHSYGLELLETKFTQGGNPVSVAVHDDLVYVANVGGTYHTAGFHLKPWGELEFIPNSKQPLSFLDTEPGAIAISPDGTKVIVTERQTGKIDVFSVAANGTLTNPVVNAPVGETEPFGASFAASGALLVTDAGTNTVSSFTIDPMSNKLVPVTLNSPSTLSATPALATCWVASGGGYAFATSTASSSVSGFKLDNAGDLTAQGFAAVEPGTGPPIFPPLPIISSFPLDLALTADNGFLYVVFSETGKLIGYKVGDDGSLTKIVTVKPYAGPEIGVEGLAVY